MIKFIQHPGLEKEELELLTVVGNYGKVGEEMCSEWGLASYVDDGLR